MYEYNANSALTNGVIEVKGDFSTLVPFVSKENHRVILSGTEKQIVNISDTSRFNVLELKNTSEEGVYSENSFNKNELILNDSKLTYGRGVVGWTLTKDEVLDSDLILVDGTLDLNGHTTIKGDLIQEGGRSKD